VLPAKQQPKKSIESALETLIVCAWRNYKTISVMIAHWKQLPNSDLIDEKTAVF